MRLFSQTRRGTFSFACCNTLHDRNPKRVFILVSSKSNPNDELDLDDTSMKTRFGFRSCNVLQQANENVPRLVWLNNRIHPAAGGAVPDVGLFFVALLHFYAE